MKRAVIIFIFLLVAGIGIMGGALYLRERRVAVPVPVANQTPEAPSPESRVPAPATPLAPGRSLADCASLARESAQYACFADVVGKNGTDETCAPVGEAGRNACLAWVITVQAMAAKDLARCEVIASERLKSYCTESVSSSVSAPATSDADDDGLPDADEARYGADPYSADTDRDGYRDGDEVKNGYNPAGPGKL